MMNVFHNLSLHTGQADSEIPKPSVRPEVFADALN